MKLFDFTPYGKDFCWNLDIIGECAKGWKTRKDEEHLVYAFMDTMRNADVLNCSMKLPGTWGAEDNEVSVIAQFRNRATDHFVYKALDYLKHMFSLVSFRAELQAWKEPDNIGWMFYQGIYLLNKKAKYIDMIVVSYDETKLIVEDRKVLDWANVSDLLIDMRENIIPPHWGNRGPVGFDGSPVVNV